MAWLSDCHSEDQTCSNPVAPAIKKGIIMKLLITLILTMFCFSVLGDCQIKVWNRKQKVGGFKLGYEPMIKKGNDSNMLILENGAVLNKKIIAGLKKQGCLFIKQEQIK